MVGRSMSHLLKILGLGLGASETEIKIHYRQLARKYHPDKNDHAATGLTTEEATEFFKLLNNANDYLRERAKDVPVVMSLLDIPDAYKYASSYKSCDYVPPYSQERRNNFSRL
jgi:hypothetical protein